eukprot:GHVS01053634.1.p1 GENE.GHVS01053634.1~~GHVS01053634.1.p1  ORF type:complete len:406 (+),score=26.12 GHVS01053634.1:100-1317(+)
MKGWKKFSLWAGLSSSYANAVTFLSNGMEVSKALSKDSDMNDLLDGKCNIHGSILNSTEEFPRTLLSMVRSLETKLQTDLDNGRDLKLQAVWNSLLSHTPGDFRQDTLGNLETITFLVTESFPKGSSCRLTDKDGKKYLTIPFDFTLGRTKKITTVNIKWPGAKSIPVGRVAQKSDASLDHVARGGWCSLKLRGLELPEEAVVGFIPDKDCFVTVVFDANVTDGELVVRNNHAFYMITKSDGEIEVKREIDIGAKESALLTMSHVAADKYCTPLLKDTHDARLRLFNPSISGNRNFMATFNFLLPYSFADLSELAGQVNRIDKLSGRMQENGDYEAACQLIDSITKEQMLGDIRRFKWIISKACKALKKVADAHSNDNASLECNSEETLTDANITEALQILKGSN